MFSQYSTTKLITNLFVLFGYNKYNNIPSEILEVDLGRVKCTHTLFLFVEVKRMLWEDSWIEYDKSIHSMVYN